MAPAASSPGQQQQQQQRERLGDDGGGGGRGGGHSSTGTRMPLDGHPAASPSPRGKTPLTPQQIERMVRTVHARAAVALASPSHDIVLIYLQEASRAKAKALRAERERLAQAATTARTASSQLKRAAPPPDVPESQRDARRVCVSATDDGAAQPARPLDEIRPARKFVKYVDYDFSKMTDTKGGFLTAEDDPYNKALHARDDGAGADGKPPHMTQREWERAQLQRAMQAARADPFAFGPSYLQSEHAPRCRECASTEIDWKWFDTFNRIAVCNACKDKFPEKYSLLTKTEAREDYLLTEPELKDTDILPHLEKPNPHKATWNSMMLFLRCQVEAYAFSAKKWGSPEALDAEFARREALRKRQKEAKFRSRLHELKKRTLVESSRRARQRAREGRAGADDAAFGEVLAGGGAARHVHAWGRAVMDPETGMGVKRCADCGMEVEELEL
ncbi:hypothetical protein KEM52_001980 [Ascosphaera acerosa]|nr:hypothetical protein KEM52_001980 [Ascosphaera acerosa]